VTTRQALAQAVGSWVKLIQGVEDRHRTLAQKHAAWAGDVGATLGAVALGANAKMLEAEEATAKLKSGIDGLSDAAERVEKLRNLAEDASRFADQRLTEVSVRARDAHAKAARALEATPRVLKSCAEGRAVIEQKRKASAAQRAELEANLVTLRGELARLEIERLAKQEADASVKEKVFAKAAEAKQIEQLKRDAPRRQKELRDAQARALALQPDLAKATQERADLRLAVERVLGLQEELRNLRAEAEELRPTAEKASEVEARRRELTRQLDSMQKIIGEAASIRRATRVLAKQVRKARRNGAAGVSRATALRAKVDRLRGRIDVLGAARIPPHPSGGERRSWMDRLRFWRRRT